MKPITSHKIAEACSRQGTAARGFIGFALGTGAIAGWYSDLPSLHDFTKSNPVEPDTELLGGTITAESQAGNGSTFTVSIPSEIPGVRQHPDRKDFGRQTSGDGSKEIFTEDGNPNDKEKRQT